jgi:hypothetical protein
MIWRLDGKRCLFVIICAVLFTACLGISVCAQSAEQDWEKAAGGKQQFEVASVRENKAGGDSNSNFTLDGNGNAYWVMDKDVKTAPEGSLFRATNQTLMRYIIFAYKLNGTEELALRVHQCPDAQRGPGSGWICRRGWPIRATTLRHARRPAQPKTRCG